MNIYAEVVLFVILSAGCYLVSGIIHELGHVITGLLHGWKFMILVVRPAGIKKDEGRLKLYI